MTLKVDIHIEPSLLAVRGAAAVFRAVIAELGSQEERQELELAFVEACTNSCKHGSRGNGRKDIHIGLEASPNSLSVLIEDGGHAFDPFKKERQIDFENIEGLPCGGYGLDLIRLVCDSVDYEHDATGNHLTLRKEFGRECLVKAATEQG